MLKFLEKWFHGSQKKALTLGSLGLDLADSHDPAAPVGPDHALGCSAVFACVRTLSETLGSLPLHVYQREAGGKFEDRENPLDRLLSLEPNPGASAYSFIQRLMFGLTLRGNAYAEIERRRGRVVALWPIDPDRVLVKDADGLPVYSIAEPGGTRPIPAADLLHFKGLVSEGHVGIAPLTVARRSIRLALNAENFGSRLFLSGSRPAGVLETDQHLSQEAITNLAETWNQVHQGLLGAHKTAVLEGGLKFKPISIPPEDAQFLETRKFQVAEIARIFRVPLHLIGDLEKATFSNIEHQSLEFVTRTILPYARGIEQELNRKLFRPGENRFAEFLFEGLLRGDLKTRYESYAIARQNGWLSVNDIRRIENMNPIPGGDEYLRPMNLTPIGSPAEDLLREGR